MLSMIDSFKQNVINDFLIGTFHLLYIVRFNMIHSLQGLHTIS